MGEGKWGVVIFRVEAVGRFCLEFMMEIDGEVMNGMGWDGTLGRWDD